MSFFAPSLTPTPSSAVGPPARLQLSGITKRYPAVVANNAVSLTVQPGEIHADESYLRCGAARRRQHLL